MRISDAGNVRIREVSNGTITTYAGGGNGGLGDGGAPTNATLGSPQELALDAAGDLYVADSASGRIRKIANNIITTVAGGGNVLPGAKSLAPPRPMEWIR